MRYSILLVCVALIAGCGKPPVTQIKSNVPLDQVPAVVLKTARSRDPAVRFSEAIKRADGIYEVQGKNKSGKLIRVEVTEAGQFVKFG
jgi:hypothetical protein